MDTNPALARHVVKDLAGRVMHLIRMVEDLSLRTVEARLARLLLFYYVYILSFYACARVDKRFKEAFDIL